MFDRILQNESDESTLYKVKDFIEYLLKNDKNWIYCYQLNKEQFVLRKIIS
jgi:hypothetical protein